jgi:hypothetical protein
VNISQRGAEEQDRKTYRITDTEDIFQRYHNQNGPPITRHICFCPRGSLTHNGGGKTAIQHLANILNPYLNHFILNMMNCWPSQQEIPTFLNYRLSNSS